MSGSRRFFSAWKFFKDFPRVIPYIRPYWRLAAASVGMIGLGTLASLVAPWPLAILIDTVLGNKPLPSLLGFLGSWDRSSLLIFAVVSGVLVTAFEHGLGVAGEYVSTKLDQRMVLDLRSDLFEHAQGLSQAYHDRSRTGMLMFRINTQSAAVGAITVALPPLAQALATLVGMFLIVLLIDPQLALISLTVVPFIYYSTGFYATRIQPRLYHVRALEGQSLSIVYEAMTMLRVIVAFGRERHEYDRFRRQGEKAVGARVGLSVRQTVFSMAVNVITAAGTALVLGFGGWKAMQGQLTAGELLVILSYIAAVYAPLTEIASTIATLQEQFIALRSSLDLLDVEPEIKEAPDARVHETTEGRITFEGIQFSYEGRVGTLQDISFEAEPGRTIGIVGPTGAGKTTLVALIPRFYDPKEGRILLDGIDIRELSLASLRRHISVVHQEPMLFSGTIADNIGYGRLEAGMGEIVAAAEAANAHDFISRLPKQYETELGEGGHQLSGGERQRICVARAFLKDAPILILDEPTASVDSRTETVILDALKRLMVGRTSFTIAHRLSTIRDADHILVLDGGRIVEQGTHEDLLARDGLYRQLHDAQAGLRRLRLVEASEQGDPANKGRPLEPTVDEAALRAAAVAAGAPGRAPAPRHEGKRPAPKPTPGSVPERKPEATPTPDGPPPNLDTAGLLLLAASLLRRHPSSPEEAER